MSVVTFTYFVTPTDHLDRLSLSLCEVHNIGAISTIMDIVIQKIYSYS